MDRRDFLTRASMAGGVLAAGAMAGSAVAQTGSGKLLMRRIPSTGEMLPAIGLGTSGPFEVSADEEARAPLRAVLQEFFAAGATLIDTSPMYSTAEAVLGDLLTAEQQARVFLATKVWTPHSGGRGEERGVEQMRRSATLLKHPRLDLMQVHNLIDLDAHLRTLRRLKAEGTVRYIGVTHYTTASYPDLIAIVEREKIDFVQFNYSVATREAEKRLLPLCADKGVAVIINRAFEDGDLFARVKGKPVPAFAQEFGATSWAQIFLKFVLANPAVTCVIPATGKVRNLADNMAAGLGPLPTSRQLGQIVAALA